MISQSKTLSFSSPQLIPGISLSVCICLNCRPSRIAALDWVAGEAVAVLLAGGEAMMVRIAAAGMDSEVTSFDSVALEVQSSHKVTRSTISYVRRLLVEWSSEDPRLTMNPRDAVD